MTNTFLALSKKSDHYRDVLRHNATRKSDRNSNHFATGNQKDQDAMSNRFNPDHYAEKGSTQGHMPDSEKQQKFSVLSYNPSKFHYAENTPEEHEFVVLQQGKGSNAKIVAYFSVKQAQELADALNAAVSQHEIC